MDEGSKVVEGLTDPQGRRLTYLRLGVTERCDLRCSYCREPGVTAAAADRLSPADLRTLGFAFARQLGFRKVRLTGGEPLLREDLPDLIRFLREDAGFARVAVTTNGRLLGRRVAALVAAGLQHVNVSLDTLCASSYAEIRGRDAFDDVVAGIDAALAAGLRDVHVNVVLLRSFGFAEFDRFLEWGLGRPLELRFIELMPVAGNEAFYEREHVDSGPLAARVLAAGYAPMPRETDRGPAMVYGRPDDPFRVGFVTPVSRPFCATCNRLRVTPRGALKLCLFGRGSIDLTPYLAEGPEAVAAVVRGAVVDRECGDRPVGREIERGEAGMRGIGG